MGLKSKTVKGLGWSFADNAANQGLRFLVGLVLARLVTPHDYGLIGIALIFVTVFESVVDGGFTNALIQKKLPTEKDYGTAFLTNTVVSLFIYAIIFLLAPKIAIFFNHEPQIVNIVRVVSCLLVIDALVLVPRARLTKAMDFKIQTKISLVSSVFAGVTGISMAFCGMGVWALVGQQLARHGCNSLLLSIICRHNLTFSFSKESFRSLFSFGSKLLLSDLINSIYRQFYSIVIAKCFSPVTLGHYTRAHQFSTFFSVTFTQIVQKVSFPALSSIQDEDEKVREGYRMLIKYSMFIDLICMLGLAAVSRPMIVTLIGSQWLEAVPYLQILCFMMMFYPLQAINLNILKVKGRSDLFLRLEIINRVLGIFPLLTGIIFHNIYWMLIGSVIAEIIGYYLNSHYSGKLIGYSISQQVKDIFPEFCIASLIAIILYCMSFAEFTDYILFPLQIVAGIILVVLFSEITRLDAYLGIKSIICSRYSK
jgi:O-antigen/teichoic acid export membrane protein